MNDDPLFAIRCKPDLFKLLDGLIAGVEVGVLRGAGSESILHNSSIKRLYSIDHWDHEDKSDLSNFEDYMHTVARLFKYGHRNTIIKMDANEAVEMFQDNSLCFVYIDAGLSYDLYLEHVEAWWPKIKDGGIFGGHIFEWMIRNGQQEETDAPELVSKLFAEKYSLERHIVINRPIPPNADPASFRGSRTWIVRKPHNKVIA